MILELTQAFYFEAAHTLDRECESAPSLRIHGHTYHGEVTVRGEKQQDSGMVLDLSVLRAHIETVRELLDHRMLNTVPGLGPPTLENLAAFIADRLRSLEPRVCSVRVSRKASGDSCLWRVDPSAN
ncbi:MAG: 6-carboxytetrahydropterin synthase [Gammaproteobacteria bacterium]